MRVLSPHLRRDGPDLAGLHQPFHLVAQRFLIGMGVVTQLADGLAGIEAVVPREVVDGKSGHQRPLASAPGAPFENAGQEVGRAGGQEEAQGLSAAGFGQHL